jgi:hypothetical protein
MESYLAILFLGVMASMFIASRWQSDGNGNGVMA